MDQNGESNINCRKAQMYTGLARYVVGRRGSWPGPQILCPEPDYNNKRGAIVAQTLIVTESLFFYMHGCTIPIENEYRGWSKADPARFPHSLGLRHLHLTSVIHRESNVSQIMNSRRGHGVCMLRDRLGYSLLCRNEHVAHKSLRDKGSMYFVRPNPVAAMLLTAFPQSNSYSHVNKRQTAERCSCSLKNLLFRGRAIRVALPYTTGHVGNPDNVLLNVEFET